MDNIYTEDFPHTWWGSKGSEETEVGIILRKKLFIF